MSPVYRSLEGIKDGLADRAANPDDP